VKEALDVSDQIRSHQLHLSSWNDHLLALELQLTQNRQAAENEVKLKKQ
jgi:hypothetical protein